MSKIKNVGLDQYGAGSFEQQQFGTTGVERVKLLKIPPPKWPRAATPLVNRERRPWVKFIRPTPTRRGRYNKDSKRLQQQRNSAVTKQRPYRFQIKTTQSKVIGIDYLRVSTLRTTRELG